MDGSMTSSRAVRLADATLSDLDLILPSMRSDEIAQYLAVTGEKRYCPLDAAFLFARITGPRWTLVDARGRPLVTGGIETLREGVGRAWMAGTMAAWNGYGWQITRICRRLFSECVNGGHYQRLEILALPERTEACDWYKRGLGFEFEGLRKRYHNGHDFVAYVKTGV